jgi:PAS domain S-box-containing protein
VLQHSDSAVRTNESEARFRALAEASWEGICFSANGVIIDANPQLAALLGYEHGELAGRNVLDLIAPASMASVLRAMRVRTSTVNEFQALRKDGSVITVEVRAQSVTYQGRAVRMTAVRDVTDRIRAAEHRRALVAGTAGATGQHFFRSLVKHLARALDARCALVAELVAPANTELTVLSAWDENDHVRLANAPLSATVIADVIEGGLRFFDGDMAHRFGQDGLLADLEVSSCAAIALQDASGRPIGVLAVASGRALRIDDELVSTLRVFAARAGVEIERIRGEREVRRFQLELEQRVADRTTELESVNRDLEAFSYSVSHDLRAPLRQIGGFAKLLERELGDRQSPTVRQHLADIHESTEKMTALIDTLLDFSRLGRVALTCRETEMRPLVDEVIDELDAAADGRVIDWRIQALPRAWCDPALIRLVVTNLIANAVKFTRSRHPAVIEITATEDDRQAIYCVRDNGVGFNMQLADKLYAVFQRLHPPSQFEGTGIGLANVHRIITRHGGRVWAQGAVDRGAAFYFSLPRRSAGSVAA